MGEVFGVLAEVLREMQRVLVGRVVFQRGGIEGGVDAGWGEGTYDPSSSRIGDIGRASR